MKNKKLVGCLVVMVFVMMILGSIGNSKNLNNTPILSQGEIEPDKLIIVDFPVYINNKSDWSYYVENYDWCSGKGIKEDPYIIEGIYVTNEKQTARISIQNTEHFIIRNCTFYNYSDPCSHYTDGALYIGNGAFGLIDNCIFINCSRGISLSNGYNLEDITNTIKITNCNFIGSHNDPDTGMGCAIKITGVKFGYGIDPDVEITTNVENVNISYNDIYNYYDGVVVSNAEKIFVENNRIEASFVNITYVEDITVITPYVSNTGVYFKNVSDSTIINNDFYGCEPTTQDSTQISTSSFDDDSIIILEDCYNIEIYGNNYFDIPENLIIPEEPDNPDDPYNPDDSDDSDIPEDLENTTQNYILFILSGVVIVFVVITIVVIIDIFKKNKD